MHFVIYCAHDINTKIEKKYHTSCKVAT